MKLVGKYYPQYTDKYKDVLLARGIDARLGVEDNEPSEAIGADVHRTCLYVADGDYDRAARIVDEYAKEEARSREEMFRTISSWLVKILLWAVMAGVGLWWVSREGANSILP